MVRYILAENDKAAAAGFTELCHRVNGKYMILNSKEVMMAASLSGTLEERAAALGGEPMRFSDVMLKIRRKGAYHFKL